MIWTPGPNFWSKGPLAPNSKIFYSLTKPTIWVSISCNQIFWVCWAPPRNRVLGETTSPWKFGDPRRSLTSPPPVLKKGLFIAMNSDTFYVLISGNRGKGSTTVNFVLSWSFCTKRFGKTSGADLGGHWRSQLMKTSGLGGSKSSFLARNWSVFIFLGSQHLLDDWVKFQPDSNDKFDVLGSIPAP